MPVGIQDSTPVKAQPKPDNANSAAVATSSGGDVDGNDTQNVRGDINTQLQNSIIAVKTPSGTSMAAEANTNSIQDYVTRANSLGNDTQKVALVGRTGAGTRSLTGGFGGNTTNITSLNDPKTNSPILSSVIFDATPDMSESGTTTLIDIGDIRAAASVVIYMGSPSRAFNLNARFISRTAKEATKNNNYINLLKAWRMPTLKAGESFNAEPETLRLFAYGNIMRGIPVMLQSINTEYSSEIDYIQTEDGTAWVPIVQNVNIVLKEVRSVEDLAGFDYTAYKSGILKEW